MKRLVYFSVGHNYDYNKMLELSILSLKMFYNGDILIITDLNNSLILKENEFFNGVDYLITPTAYDRFSSSLNKLKIFQYNKFFEYDEILYLDCDTIVTNNIDVIFEKVKSINKFSVTIEEYTSKNRYFGEQLAYSNNTNLPKNNYGFRKGLNSGVFCFPVNQKSYEILKNMYYHALNDYNNLDLHYITLVYSEQPYFNFHLVKESYYFEMNEVLLLNYKTINKTFKDFIKEPIYEGTTDILVNNLNEKIIYHAYNFYGYNEDKYNVLLDIFKFIIKQNMNLINDKIKSKYE